MKKSPRTIGLGILIFSLPIATFTHVARAHHASLVLSHYFGGRAGNCNLSESFEGEALSRQQLENVTNLRAFTKVVEKDDHFSRWRTPSGDFWMPTASGDALIYDLGEQERNIYGNGVHKGDIVLDAGANVGVFVRKALAAGASKVIAIEPAPENLECLRRNFAAEIADGRVVLYAKGVWDQDDVLKLKIDPNDSAKDTFVRQIDNAQFLEVPLTTIDHLVAELHLPRVDFIKMDIEGAERKAVTGARETLKQFRPRMALCIYHIKGDEVEIPALVRQAVGDYKVSKSCLAANNLIQPEVAFFN